MVSSNLLAFSWIVTISLLIYVKYIDGFWLSECEKQDRELKKFYGDLSTEDIVLSLLFIIFFTVTFFLSLIYVFTLRWD
jgi:hypothetical protein